MADVRHNYRLAGRRPSPGPCSPRSASISVGADADPMAKPPDPSASCMDKTRGGPRGV